MTEAETETSALADKIDRVLTEYLNSTNSAIKECEARALREILWDNKAGIVAGLRKSGLAPTPTVLAALMLAEDVLSRSPFSTDIWPNGAHPNTSIKKIRDAIKSLSDTSTAAPAPTPAHTELLKKLLRLDWAADPGCSALRAEVDAALASPDTSSTDRQVNEIAARSPEVPKATIQKLLEATDGLCSDCPPVGYETDRTRCLPCPRRAPVSSPDRNSK